MKEIEIDKGFAEAVKAVDKIYTLSEPGVLPSVFAEFFRQGVLFGTTYITKRVLGIIKENSDD